MEYENAMTKIYDVLNYERAIQNAVIDGFRYLKKELISEMDLLLTQNKMESTDNFDEKQLINKIDGLEQLVKTLIATCDSLYKVMRSFK